MFSPNLPKPPPVSDRTAPFPPLGMAPPNNRKHCFYFHLNGGYVCDDDMCPRQCRNSKNRALGPHVHCGYCGTGVGKKNWRRHLRDDCKQLPTRSPLASVAAPSAGSPNADRQASLTPPARTHYPSRDWGSGCGVVKGGAGQQAWAAEQMKDGSPVAAVPPVCVVSTEQPIVQCTSEGSSTTGDTVQTFTKSVGTEPDGACMA